MDRVLGETIEGEVVSAAPAPTTPDLLEAAGVEPEPCKVSPNAEREREPAAKPGTRKGRPNKSTREFREKYETVALQTGNCPVRTLFALLADPDPRIKLASAIKLLEQRYAKPREIGEGAMQLGVDGEGQLSLTWDQDAAA